MWFKNERGFQLECRGLVKRYSIKYFRRKTRTTNRFVCMGFEPINLFEDKQIYKTAYRTHQVYIRIIPVPVWGGDKLSSIIFLAVLLYKKLVYFKCKMEEVDPRRTIKYLIWCYPNSVCYCNRIKSSNGIMTKPHLNK